MGSASKILSSLLAKGTDISRRTVSRRLVDDFDLKAHKPAHKPRLTQAMKSKRLAFAKKHLKWTIQQWQQVLFSDESSVQQFTNRKRYLRRPSRKRFSERYTIQTMKHPQCHDLGGMSINETAGLFFLPPGTTINGQKYLDLLKNKLKLQMAVHKCSVFMQDGAPCHHAKIVIQFLKAQKINILDWPGNSPNLNPIENLWTILKNKVSERQSTNAKMLEPAIKEVWVRDISAAYCRNLVESMPRRLEAVIKAKGGPTKY